MSRDVRIAELIEANPTLEQQMRDWQAEQHRRGENPFDWQAFRIVMGYVGACDPGDEPPSEFFWFAPPDGGMSPVPDLGVSTSDIPSGRLVSPGRDRASSLTEMKYWR